MSTEQHLKLPENTHKTYPIIFHQIDGNCISHIFDIVLQFRFNLIWTVRSNSNNAHSIFPDGMAASTGGSIQNNYGWANLIKISMCVCLCVCVAQAKNIVSNQSVQDSRFLALTTFPCHHQRLFQLILSWTEMRERRKKIHFQLFPINWMNNVWTSGCLDRRARIN